MGCQPGKVISVNTRDGEAEEYHSKDDDGWGIFEFIGNTV